MNLQLYVPLCEGLNEESRETYGVPLDEHVIINDGTSTSHYTDAEQFESYLDKAFEQQFLEKTWLENSERVLGELNEITSESEKFVSQDFSTLANEELGELQLRLWKKLMRVFARRNEGIFLEEKFFEKLKKELKEKVSEKEASACLEAVLSPLTPTPVVSERIELLEIAVKAKGGEGKPEIDRLLEEHARKYAWFPNYSYHTPPFSKKDFSEQLSILLEDFPDPKAELERLEGVFEARQEKFKQLLYTPSNDEELKFLLKASVKMIELREFGDCTRRRFYHNFRFLMLEISKRTGLSLSELNLCTPSEVKEILSEEKTISKQDLETRRKAFLLVMKNGEFELYSGENALVISKKLLGNLERTENELLGTPACQGKSQGAVALINSQEDLSKVVKGSILVSVKTGPDYIPAMRKAAAIVTDEGGLTSHAAIVAREFNIPCIVGTKTATTMLKDGDVVEVDANKGFVRKLGG